MYRQVVDFSNKKSTDLKAVIKQQSGDSTIFFLLSVNALSILKNHKSNIINNVNV